MNKKTTTQIARKMNKYIYVFVLWILLAGNNVLYAQKRMLEHSDVAKWNKIKDDKDNNSLEETPAICLALTKYLQF